MSTSTTRTASSDIAAQLARIPLFASVAPDTLAALAASARRHRWTSGGMIFQRGDQGDQMLAIVEGRVRLSLATAGGRELMLRQIGPGEVLGELALLDGEPRSADAVAVEDTVAIILPRARFLALAEERPDLGLALARHLCAMVRATTLQMESIALYDLRMRVIRFLLLQLRQAYGSQLPAEAALPLWLSQSDLSAILGASRPKVNQALGALIAVGALRREGRRTTCITRRLRELAAEGEEGGLP